MPDRLIGESSHFLAVLEHVSKIAPLVKPVIIIGERGTGKELIAARLHFLSKRWNQPFIKLNCAAINENLLESELFGHEAGSFTGATKRHLGRFERADLGTLFLDELATTKARVQEQLLRVIEYGEFERVGAKESVKVDVRLIAATNEDLPSLAEQGKFRYDLLDRLAFDVITLPPLRERPDDILLLAEHFATHMAYELGWGLFPGFAKHAKDNLLDYGWPGNVRELKNAVERSLYRHEEPTQMIESIITDPFASPFRPSAVILSKDCVSPEIQTPAENYMQDNKIQDGKVTFPLDFKKVTQNFEVNILQQALAHNQYNQRKTAVSLQLSYHQLRGYLKKYEADLVEQ